MKGKKKIKNRLYIRVRPNVNDRTEDFGRETKRLMDKIKSRLNMKFFIIE